MYLRHKGIIPYKGVYFYIGKNTRSNKHTFVGNLSLCRSNGAVYFSVRGFGRALFSYAGGIWSEKEICIRFAGGADAGDVGAGDGDGRNDDITAESKQL